MRGKERFSAPGKSLTSIMCFSAGLEGSPGLNRLRKNLLDEGDGLQPVRLNVKKNRLQPRRVLLRTEKQCPQGLKKPHDDYMDLCQG